MSVWLFRAICTQYKNECPRRLARIVQEFVRRNYDPKNETNCLNNERLHHGKMHVTVTGIRIRNDFIAKRPMFTSAARVARTGQSNAVLDMKNSLRMPMTAHSPCIYLDCITPCASACIDSSIVAIAIRRVMLRATSTH